jgi:Holliday junction DNA helicase RuvA
MPLSDLRLAIVMGDLNALSRAPGIGKKTAQRIALELKDKVADDALSSGIGVDDLAFVDTESAAQDPLGEAIQALKSLGYTPQEAAYALKGAKEQGKTADELIRLALRNMTQQG